MADRTLVETFQATITRLEKDQSLMQTEMLAIQTQLNDIKKENEIITKILQGRDDGFLAYQARGRRLMDRVDNEVIPLLKDIYAKLK